MGVFQWEEMYSVQVASFDRQHRGLFRTVHELNEALRAGCGKDVAGKILQQLIDYTASHFAAEEEVMDMADYPELRRTKVSTKHWSSRCSSFRRTLRPANRAWPWR